MMHPSSWPILLVAVWLAGCHRSPIDTVALESEGTSGSSGDTSAAPTDSSDETTGEPFDASRWIGRYHFENTFLPFGEHGYPGGTFSLTNFEILPDSRATMFYDNCTLEEPIFITYEWRPSDDGWLDLYPGEGETSLRFLANPSVDAIRVQLLEPCRELEFEVHGRGLSFTIVRPGESCWVDKCTTGATMQIDYCEGEEPEEVCE